MVAKAIEPRARGNGKFMVAEFEPPSPEGEGFAVD
jgi:hypothetical protein